MENPYGRPPLSRREKVALSVAGITILVASALVVYYMMTHKPKAQRSKPAPIAPLVQVRDLQPGSFTITVPVMGTVVPAIEVDLKAKVSGEVIWTSPEFVDGGIVRKGQVLVKIDPVDYKLALTAKKAVLETAIADLKAEQGQQQVAKAEWDLLGLGKEASAQDQELALRQPQLASQKAKLEAAQAEVRQAELDLQRTVIKAPFNAIIRSTSIGIGGQAAAQGTLAHLVDSNKFYIQALVPMDRLKWITLPDGPGSQGSTASVKTGDGPVREGKVFKLMSDLQPEGRLARLLIKVQDPLELNLPPASRKPMLLGDYVSIDIQGSSVDNVFRIGLQYIRDGNKVYTVDSGNRLHIIDTEVVWRTVDQVLARGIDPRQKLVVSSLSAPVEGMEVRVEEEK